MRRGLAFAVFLVLLADALAAAAASPAFGRQRRRAPAVSAEPELPPAPVLPPAPEIRVRSAPAPDARLFPRPPAIEDRVRFWTRVYSEVETNEGFVHDNRDLGVVYDVVRWPKGVPESEASRQYEGSKKRYAAVLRRLAREPHTGLTAEEQRVLALFPKDVSRARLEEASEGVRFQRGQADKFRDGVIRSGQWEAYIRQVFGERGLPLELGLLPHVESSFNPIAYSKVGAAGLWQFMPSTGRLFKLRVDRTMDERFDPWRATEAAAALLANNHRVTGTWPLALIAYNHGPGGSIRAKKELGTDDIGVILSRYEGPSFGFASRNFYPSFLAAVDVDRNHVRYFGEIRKMAPARHEAVVTDGYYSARAISQSFGMDLGLLREWNLGLREPVWRGQQLVPKGVTLRFPPVAGRAPAAQVLAAMPQERRPSQVAGRSYIVKRGDTLSSIARRYGVSTRALASANGIRRASSIHVGRRLRIPGAVEQEIVADASERRPPPPRARAAAATTHHKVRRGETLASIARRYGVSTHALASANGVHDPDTVRVGQRLAIPGTAPQAPREGAERRSSGSKASGDAPVASVAAASRTYTVRRGDTLSSIARRHGVSLGDLLAANNLDSPSRIHAGQKLQVPGSGG